MRKFAISNPFRSLSEIKHSFLRLLKSAYKWQLWRKHYIQSILKSKTFCFCNLIHIRHFVQLNNFNDNNRSKNIDAYQVYEILEFDFPLLKENNIWITCMNMSYNKIIKIKWTNIKVNFLEFDTLLATFGCLFLVNGTGKRKSVDRQQNVSSSINW
jgi:hypothetical protein